MRALARAMNFTLQLYEPANADTEMWGRKDENGTYSGILGEMVKRKCISFIYIFSKNNLFIFLFIYIVYMFEIGISHSSDTIEKIHLYTFLNSL